MFSWITRDAKALIHYATAFCASPWEIIPVQPFRALGHKALSQLWSPRSLTPACEAKTGRYCVTLSMHPPHVGLSVCMFFSPLDCGLFKRRDCLLSFLSSQCPAWHHAVKFHMSYWVEGMNERKNKRTRLQSYRVEEEENPAVLNFEDNLGTLNLILLDDFLAVLLWIWNHFMLKFIYYSWFLYQQLLRVLAFLFWWIVWCFKIENSQFQKPQYRS